MALKISFQMPSPCQPPHHWVLITFVWMEWGCMGVALEWNFESAFAHLRVQIEFSALLASLERRFPLLSHRQPPKNRCCRAPASISSFRVRARTPMPLAAVSSAPPHPMAPSPSPSLAPPLLPPRRQIRPPPWSRAPDADELRREDQGEGRGLCWPRIRWCCSSPTISSALPGLCDPIVRPLAFLGCLRCPHEALTHRVSSSGHRLSTAEFIIYVFPSSSC